MSGRLEQLVNKVTGARVKKWQVSWYPDQGPSRSAFLINELKSALQDLEERKIDFDPRWTDSGCRKLTISIKSQCSISSGKHPKHRAQDCPKVRLRQWLGQECDRQGLADSCRQQEQELHWYYGLKPRLAQQAPTQLRAGTRRH